MEATAMKKVLVLSLILSVLLSFNAYATENSIGFTGTQAWPGFNGINLGTAMPVVLLFEERYNGMIPELVEPKVESIRELVEEREVKYSIGNRVIYGEKCELLYVFYENMLSEVTAVATFENKEEAIVFCEVAQGNFIEQYGNEYEDTLDLYQTMKVDETLFANHWMVSSHMLPGMIEYEIEGHLTPYSQFPQEYCWAQESIYSYFDDGTYRVVMTIAMPYSYVADETVEYEANVNGRTLEDMLELYGDEYPAKYHDSRYFLND